MLPVKSLIFIGMARSMASKPASRSSGPSPQAALAVMKNTICRVLDVM